MTSKTPSIISTVLTVILLLLIGTLGMFLTMVMLNGFSGSQGGPALTTTFVCNGIGVILSAIISWRMTRWLIERFNWNKALAVATSVLAGVVFGLGLSFVSIFIGVAVADILWNAR
ncbi:MAG: hypothetical protein JNK32_11645 [Anaerolineales bacterium]|nr:hypothetical protein [Anaerolineales bacterium]